MDTIGPEERVLIREVSLFQKYTNMILEEEESVLFERCQGCPYRGVPLYTDTTGERTALLTWKQLQ